MHALSTKADPACLDVLCRPKVYQPRNAKESHPAFPNLPAPHFDDPAMFEKFDLDTLFFIFYFQQGTHHQVWHTVMAAVFGEDLGLNGVC